MAKTDAKVRFLLRHLRSLGIHAQRSHENPLQEVGTGRPWWLWWLYWKNTRSLGLIQLDGTNIGYANIIVAISRPPPLSQYPIPVHYESEEYRLEYLVVAREISSNLSRKTKVRKRLRHRLWGKVIDIHWRGGDLSEILNGDPLLKENLLAQCRENRKLGIEIVREPTYECVRIKTRPAGMSSEYPSRNMFDCLDRIAGHVIGLASPREEKKEKVARIWNGQIATREHTSGKCPYCESTSVTQHLEDGPLSGKKKELRGYYYKWHCRCSACGAIWFGIE